MQCPTGNKKQFSLDKQKQLSSINQTGQCIYYVALCIMQCFNLLTTRTRETLAKLLKMSSIITIEDDDISENIA